MVNIANKKLTYPEFCIKAVMTLRKPGYNGLHVVYSKFNSLVTLYYGEDVSPLDVTKAGEEAGVVILKPVKAGKMMFLTEDVKNFKETTLLAKMGLEPNE